MGAAPLRPPKDPEPADVLTLPCPLTEPRLFWGTLLASAPLRVPARPSPYDSPCRRCHHVSFDVHIRLLSRHDGTWPHPSSREIPREVKSQEAGPMRHRAESKPRSAPIPGTRSFQRESYLQSSGAWSFWLLLTFKDLGKWPRLVQDIMLWEKSFLICKMEMIVNISKYLECGKGQARPALNCESEYNEEPSPICFFFNFSTFLSSFFSFKIIQHLCEVLNNFCFKIQKTFKNITHDCIFYFLEVFIIN